MTIKKISLKIILPLAILLFTISGCDQSFQPIQDNFRTPFSMFGFLDVSADTQWVRVTPVREKLDLSVDVPEMMISIEDFQTGQKVSLNDSLFLFEDGFHILNAWGTPDFLKPEETYRLMAERPDGAGSSVTVTFPPDFPAPRLEIFNEVGVVFLYIKGVEQLVDVQVRTRAHVISPSARWNFVDVFWSSLVSDDRGRTGPGNLIEETAPGEYLVWMTPGDKFNVQGQLTEPPAGWDDLEINYLQHQVIVFSGGPEWNEEIRDLEDIRYSLPEVISNVEAGTGYVFGVVSKSIPFKSCFDEQEEFIACPEEVPMH